MIDRAVIHAFELYGRLVGSFAKIFDRDVFHLNIGLVPRARQERFDRLAFLIGLNKGIGQSA